MIWARVSGMVWDRIWVGVGFRVWVEGTTKIGNRVEGLGWEWFGLGFQEWFGIEYGLG